MKRLVLVALFAGVATAATAARAQDESPGEPGPAVEPHREGVYGGVNPLEPADANKVEHRDAAARRTLHWIGFRAERGGAEVFLQAAEPFTVDQRFEGRTLVVGVSGLTRLGKNARRPLDTRFFDGPIVRIAAKPRRARRARGDRPALTAGIDVVITFRDGTPATADVRTATGPDGRYYAHLTFAGGSGTVTPGAPAPATQPSP